MGIFPFSISATYVLESVSAIVIAMQEQYFRRVSLEVFLLTETPRCVSKQFFSHPPIKLFLVDPVNCATAFSEKIKSSIRMANALFILVLIFVRWAVTSLFPL